MTGEAALVALAAAIYLFDCVVLLERGQALIEARRRGLALSFGSRHYQISGKAVALMNPFTPCVPTFRSLPLFSQKSGVKLSDATQAHASLAGLSVLQFLLVFLALPWCLYRAPGWPFLLALVLAYLNAIAMLAFLFFSFRKHALPARPLAGLGFGWIVCLPLSVNCVRAAGVSFPVGADATRAMRFLRAPEKEAARKALAGQVAEAIEETEESDERHGQLAALALQLKLASGDGRL